LKHNQIIVIHESVLAAPSQSATKLRCNLAQTTGSPESHKHMPPSLLRSIQRRVNTARDQGTTQGPPSRLWRLQPAGQDGLQQLVGLGQGIIKRRESSCKFLARPFTPTYVWHVDPPLSAKIVIDVSNHIPNRRPAPPGWVVTQRNAQILITDASQHSFGLMPVLHALGTLSIPSIWDR